MSQVVTELVIDADTSGADKYSQAMDQAASSADSGMSSAQGAALAIAGVGTAAVAALVGLRAFVDYVGNQSQALVDLADHAELAGMSVKEFQQTLFAAMSKGVSDKDFTSGIEKITSDLTDAGRGATMFGKLFEANGIAIKDANGQLITTKQAVGDLADLMARATPQQQQAMAKIVGISQSWIPFLEQGTAAIEQQKQKAADLGIIIDDSAIAKAREFNDQWHAATAAWDLQFKASLASILPLMVQLANLASTVISAVGSVSSTATRLTTPVDQQTTAQLNDTINDVQRLTEIMHKFGAQSFRATNLKGALGLPEDADLKTVYDDLDKITQQYDKLQGRLHVTPAPSAGINLPALSDAKDALEHYIETVDKQIAKMQADTQTMGQNAAAIEQLRVENALYEAAQRAGITDLEKYADKFYDLSQKAGDAALALEKAKVASQIDFQSKTALLSPEDVAIANKLKGIYDVPAALASTEAAAIRVNNAIKQAKDDGVQFAQTFVNGLMQGKTAMESLSAAATQLSTKLADKAITDLFSGKFVQAGVEAIAAAGSYLIGKGTDDTASKALKDAQLAFQKMAIDVVNFNEAAKGFNLGPLTNELQSLLSSYTQIQEAALKANNLQAAADASRTFQQGVLRIVQGFKDGEQVLTPYAQAVKNISDEAQGLEDTLISLKDYSLANEVGISLQKQLDALAQKFLTTFTDSLQARINTAQGNDYLNQVASTITQHQQDILEAQQLGISPDLVNRTFDAEIQKIVNDAGLVGDSFNDFIKQFPQFAGVVTESSTALQSANDKFKQLTETISTYLNSLALGSNSTLSPQQQLQLAQSNFSQQLGLARSGDQTALGSITQSADAYLNAGKSFYASSGGYADIYNAVTSALQSLIGNSASSFSPASSLTSTSSTLGPSIPGVIVPQVTTAANDNTSTYFQTQTTALSQVFTQVGNAQIIAFQSAIADLGAKVDRVTSAIQSSRAKADRPLAKVAAGAFG